MVRAAGREGGKKGGIVSDAFCGQYEMGVRKGRKGGWEGGQGGRRTYRRRRRRSWPRHKAAAESC